MANLIHSSIQHKDLKWAEPVSLTCNFALRKLYTEFSIYVLPTKFQLNLANWI